MERVGIWGLGSLSAGAEKTVSGISGPNGAKKKDNFGAGGG